MNSVIVLTLNPAVDMTYELPALNLYDVNRVKRVFRTPGGKGINVLRVLQQLEVPSIGIGFLGGISGSWIAEELRKSGISFHAVPVKGETRTTIAVLDEAHRGTTEMIEPGPVIEVAAADELRRALESRFSDGTYVLLSGSQPQGLKATYTADLIDSARRAGCLPCVDVSGETLREALAAKPYLVKVNHTEFANWLGLSEELPLHAILQAARGLVFKGIKVVVVTLGAQGSLVVTGEQAWRVNTPTVPVRNTVGSGDAFFAGFVSQLVSGGTCSAAALYGAACGASNATFATAGMVHREQLNDLVQRVSVTPLS